MARRTLTRKQKITVGVLGGLTVTLAASAIALAALGQQVVAEREKAQAAAEATFSPAERTLVDDIRAAYQLPSSRDDVANGADPADIAALDGTLVDAAATMCALIDELEADGQDPNAEDVVEFMAAGIVEESGHDLEVGIDAYAAYLEYCGR